MLWFEPFSHHKPGLVFGMLTESYSALLRQLPGSKVGELLSQWEEYDNAVFSKPYKTGACGFFTVLDGEPVGFASWDPRRYPESGSLGHNCVLPRYQNHGYGTEQVREILGRFSLAGYEAALVRTDAHPFFAPAIRMYERCGFERIATYPGDLLEEYETVELKKDLSGSSYRPS